MEVGKRDWMGGEGGGGGGSEREDEGKIERRKKIQT